jgi:hypothetical protein
MILLENIRKAFSDRHKPDSLIKPKGKLLTYEQNEALSFDDREWYEITWEDWENNSDAFYAFTPEAFAYYLPSILSLSTKYPNRWFRPADDLIKILDRSPVIEYWDEFLSTRLLGLQSPEYEVLKEWLLFLSEHENCYDSGNTLDRAFDTVNLLQSNT